MAQNRFRMYRIRAGLTQQDVADVIGVSQVSVWQWENGDNLPRADKLIAISKLYRCTIEDLVGKADGRNDAQRNL